ncbi:MAG: hypothetical protein FJZ01_24545 [Candidatus Sericytochromatia bacterium]|nr:hypothetical protein [Candidatus Tanganyikabacteria bacterium]
MNGKYSLIGLLALFGLLMLAGLIRIMTAEQRPYAPRTSAVAAVPHKPAEYPEIFDVDPLEGLDSATAGVAEGLYPHPPPPLSPDTWPCSSCHQAGTFSRDRRDLSMHSEIVLKHGPKERWCLDCHDFQDRDSLRLASGATISFDASYQLCGQCHGTTLRDWRAGIHGKRTGYWNGAKRYMLCVSCHYPHEPHFKALKPLPPPVRPEFYRPEPAKRAAALKAAKFYGPAPGATASKEHH